jgi:MSHA biogenesis protein MshK
VNPVQVPEPAATLIQAEPTLTETTAPSAATDAKGARQFKLQGIFYRAANASALIDGQTLFVGDEIEGARVVAIERQAVRLLQNGKTIVLKLR